jgi:DNA-binding NarL/FixJ family response regulator
MKGKKVLIVEDSYLLALTLEDMLTEAGADVVGIAPSVAIALKAMERHTIDIACLDINLGGETSFPLADALAMRGIPFVFVSACGPDVPPPAHRHRPFVSKTKVHLELVSACRAAASSFVLHDKVADGGVPADSVRRLRPGRPTAPTRGDARCRDDRDRGDGVPQASRNRAMRERGR